MSSVDNQRLSADRDRLIHILVVHFDMFRSKAEEAADLFLHDKTLRASAAEVEPVAWQRRLKFDSRNMNLPGRWEQCGGEEVTGHWDRKPNYEYRPLYAQPSLVDGVEADIPASVRSFVFALFGADTWIEAGSIWDQNPEQRKAAHAFFMGAKT